MAWTKLETVDVRRVRYNARRESLDIRYTDGSVARAEGISKERFDTLIATAPVDQGDYFRNLIKPFVVRHRDRSRHFGRTLRICTVVLSVGFVLWLVFTLSEAMRFQ